MTSALLKDAKEGIEKLPVWARSELKIDLSKKFTKGDVCKIDWGVISPDRHAAILAALKVSHMRAILKIKNGVMYRKRDLDRTSVTKNELWVHMLDKSFVPNIRPKVTKDMKDRLWRTYFDNVYQGKCLCCGEVDINAANFIVGHVISVANGGPTVAENLRPICTSCNSSMSGTWPVLRTPPAE